MSEVKGQIFDLQRFCTHDGPGIRTTIFFKGCPLTCAWCSNPESQQLKPQLMFFEHLCKGCGRCLDACPNGAITVQEDSLVFNRAACTSCGSCAVVCPHESRTISGKTVTVDELVQAVRQDWQYYMEDEGGITASGGEALLQPAFLYELMLRLHDGLGYHTCLDTTACVPWPTLEKILPVLNLILLDIKHMDSAEHQRLTGIGNELILANARKLGEMEFPVLIRTPLIPGYNDTQANLEQMGEFLRQTGLCSVELMPYHKLGESKYQALGWPYNCVAGLPDTLNAVNTLTHYGLNVFAHQ